LKIGIFTVGYFYDFLSHCFRAFLFSFLFCCDVFSYTFSTTASCASTGSHWMASYAETNHLTVLYRWGTGILPNQQHVKF
jgi:hypothetical protein